MKLTARNQQGRGIDQYSSFHNDGWEKDLWRVDWKAWGYSFCGIYAISPDTRWPTKIGFSQLPARRLVDLQVACWKRLDIAGYVYCNGVKDARIIEAKVHSILTEDGLAMHGEWFDIRPEKAMEIVGFAADTLGIEIRNDIPDENIKRAIFQIRSDLGFRGSARRETDKDIKNTKKRVDNFTIIPRTV